MPVRPTLLLLLFSLVSLPAEARADVVPLDTSRVQPGPITVEKTPAAAIIRWPDETSRQWRAEFSLDSERPLLTAISVDGRQIVERARPLYWCETGKRRGGWDEFFDRPFMHPEGTRRFAGVFRLRSAKARTIGDRLEIYFDGLNLGIFQGGIAFTFFPGSRLIQQEAVASTTEPDTAYFYDAGLRVAAAADRLAGWNMQSEVAYFDAGGNLRSERPEFERTPVKARHRVIALRTARGSLAVFPPPHQYFFARDTTQNLGYLWHSSYRGEASIGIRQLPDDNLPFYPWMNAPPQTEQRMSVFYLVSDQEPGAVLQQTLRYTNRDRFPDLPGYKKLTTHWHFAYTVQAQAKGFDWTPGFKPVLKEMGVDAAMIMDFHGDGHPQDLTDVRIKELDDYYRGARANSDRDFLIIPAEEANVHLGGHWAAIFPKPVYWYMKRPADKPFRGEDSRYGTVYHVGNEQEMLDLVRREGGYMYQTHPRTKGSKGFPDKIRETAHFRDPRYLGVGWKAMPTDLASLRAGVRSLNLLDDMNNWALPKRLIGEVDVFQIDSTHELYAHMNVNYVRMDRLPDFDNYGLMLEALSRGDYFISTGEVLLPSVELAAGQGQGQQEQQGQRDQIVARAEVAWTFPLQFAEIVWSDGAETRRQIFQLDTTRECGRATFEWKLTAAGWKWARLAVWDVAGNGAFINPVWRR
jgi:hypothetical protein